MKIVGLEGLTGVQLNRELKNGARFVIFQYCISIFILTFKRSSSVYFVKANEKRVFKSFGFSIISFLLGWWGIPWGPIYTVESLRINFKGGRDVTHKVLELLK